MFLISAPFFHTRVLGSALLGRCLSSAASTVPVAVIGAGPTGLTASLLLSRLRVPHVILERRHALPTHPQAHFINYRTMEIFRCCGVVWCGGGSIRVALYKKKGDAVGMGAQTAHRLI